MPKKVRIVTNPNVIAMARLVSLLQDGTLTCRELAEETGLTYAIACRYCAALHRAGVAHIATWEQDGRGAFTIRVYKLGRGKDAESKPRDRAEKSRLDRQRAKDLNIARALAGAGGTPCPA